MFRNSKSKKASPNLNKKGFSLVEVLIAIGILIFITVPLAMNMISSSQMSSKAKQTATASDLTTSVMEVLQTVGLSNILTDMNWNSTEEHKIPTDEYGTELSYTLTEDVLSKYDKFDDAHEVVYDEDEKKYILVGDGPDAIYHPSVQIEEAGEVLKTYFVGRDDGSDEYAFLISGVENNEVYFDILTTMTPEQKQDMVNITSMNQTEVFYAKNDEIMNQNAANEFKQANDTYVALRGSDPSVQAQMADWFLKNMRRTIVVTIKQDSLTSATTVLIEAVYTIDDASNKYLRDRDQTITKNLGSFSTNSTAEFARGIYVYYAPLNYEDGTRDYFEINNQNELSIPVYLIAMSNETDKDWSREVYSPYLKVTEFVGADDAIATDAVRTIICSNIPESMWNPETYPIGKDVTIKGLGNVSEQATMYSATVKVYRHNDKSYDANGNFAPREKDLLAKVTGTFIDNSEKRDLGSDKTNGNAAKIKKAEAWGGTYEYTGNPIKGVSHNGGIEWSPDSVLEATNVGTYRATATPIEGYKWPDGTTGPKVIVWVIERARDAEASTGEVYIYGGDEYVYNGKNIVGVTGKYVEWAGITEAPEVGEYVAYATPEPNHAWSDGTWDTIELKWKIVPKPVDIIWETCDTHDVNGDGQHDAWSNWTDHDTWLYDGKTHHGKFRIEGIEVGDTCTATIKNNAIKNVGSVIAEVTGLSNKNYVLPTTNTTHELKVLSVSAANVVFDGTPVDPDPDDPGPGDPSDPDDPDDPIIDGIGDGPKDPDFKVGRSFEYDGKIHNAIKTSNGVYFTGITEAREVGTYKFEVHVMDGYAWSDGTDEPIEITWYITPKTVTLKWGECQWVYDGLEHSTTCEVSNAVPGDSVIVYLKDKDDRDGENITATKSPGITNAGTRPIVVVSLSNPNYQLPETDTPERDDDDLTKTLIVTRKPIAFCEAYDFNYDGKEHVGVVGQYIDIVDSDTGVRSVIRATDVNVTTDGKGITLSYEAWAEPKPNYSWIDNERTEKRKLTWTIYPICDSWYLWSDMAYTGYEVTGVWGVFDESKATGTTGTNIGPYTASIKPEKNHAWKNTTRSGETPYTAETRTPPWNIVHTEYIIPVLCETVYVYDGKYHLPELEATTAHSGYTMSGAGLQPHIDVGEYPITLTLKPGSKWVDGTTAPKTLTWKIVPRPVGITLTNQASSEYSGQYNAWTYDRQYHNGTATITGLCQREDTGAWDTCNFVYSDNSKINATLDASGNQSSHYFKITGVTNGNYRLPTTKGQFESISPGGNDFTSNLYPALTQTTLTNLTNAGWSEGTNCWIGKMTIYKRTVGITWGQTEWVYDGKWHALNPTATNVVSGDTCNFTFKDNNNGRRIDYGSYTVTITGVNNSNYKLPDGAVWTATIRIHKRPVGMTPDPNTWTYEPGQVRHGTATISGMCQREDTGAWDTCGFNYNYYQTQSDPYAYQDAGTYYFYVTGVTNQNYRLPTTRGQFGSHTPNTSDFTGAYGSYLTATTLQTLTNAGWSEGTNCWIGKMIINKARGEVLLSSYSGTYYYPTSGTFTVTYNKSGGTLSVSSADNNVATASISGTTVTVTPGTAVNNTVRITVKSAETKNYYAAESDPYIATVKPGTLNVTANGWSGNYDGNYHSISVSSSPSATITYSTSQNGTYSATNPSYINAGTYRVYYRVEKIGYTTVTGYKDVVINKLPGQITPPTPLDGWYNGSAQNLLTSPATSSTGTVYYSLDGSNWSTSIPTGVNVQNYTVYYYSKGDINHLDTAVGSVTAKIKALVLQALYFDSNKSLVFIYDRLYTAGETYDGKAITAVYTGFGYGPSDSEFSLKSYDKFNYVVEYNPNPEPKQNVPWYGIRTSIESVLVKDIISPTYTEAWFFEFVNCREFDLTNLNTNNVVDMSEMFYKAGCSVNGTVTIKGINNWNTSKVVSMNGMFAYTAGGAALEPGGTDPQYNTTLNIDLSTKVVTVNGQTYTAWDTSNVKKMGYMFNYSGRYSNNWSIGDLGGWNTSNVQDMMYMFEYTGHSGTRWYVGNLGNWNVSKVTRMRCMFKDAGMSSYADSFDTGNLCNWNVSKADDLARMFGWAGRYATNTWYVGDLTNWSPQNATTMNHMFMLAGGETNSLDIGTLENWNTGMVEDMNSMFCCAGKNASKFELNLAGWTVSSVTDMRSMFYQSGYNATTWSVGLLNNWEPINVTDMHGMFEQTAFSATAFNIGDITNWNTSKVTNMSNMFRDTGATRATTWNIGKFEQGDNWNTSKVTNMSAMFQTAGMYATTFDIGSLYWWNTSNVTDMNKMFQQTGRESTTWNIGSISSWDVSKVKSMERMFDNAAKKTKTFNIGALSNWKTKTGNVTDMRYMFRYTGLSATFTQDLSGWNVSKVKGTLPAVDGSGVMESAYKDFNLGNTTKIKAPNFSG